ncbi:MAG TPA: hypothetical protein VI299_01285 [Polyangiales bacterium]
MMHREADWMTGQAAANGGSTLPTSNWRVEGEGGGESPGGGLNAATVAKVLAAVGGAVLPIIVTEIEKAIQQQEFWDHPYRWCANDMAGKNTQYGEAVLTKAQQQFQTKSSEVAKGDAFVKSWAKSDRQALAKTLSTFTTLQDMTSYMDSYTLNGASVPFIPGSSFLVLMAQIYL